MVFVCEGYHQFPSKCMLEMYDFDTISSVSSYSCFERITEAEDGETSLPHFLLTAWRLITCIRMIISKFNINELVCNFSSSMNQLL